MGFPIAANFEDARFFARELSGDFGFRARVDARAGELQRLQGEERSLEKRLQDVVSSIAVEDVGVAGRVVDPRCANTGGLQGVVLRERTDVGERAEKSVRIPPSVSLSPLPLTRMRPCRFPSSVSEGTIIQVDMWIGVRRGGGGCAAGGG